VDKIRANLPKENIFSTASSGAIDPLGGITMSSSSLDLQIKRDGNGIPLPMMEQPPEIMNIQVLRLKF